MINFYKDLQNSQREFSKSASKACQWNLKVPSVPTELTFIRYMYYVSTDSDNLPKVNSKKMIQKFIYDLLFIMNIKIKIKVKMEATERPNMCIYALFASSEDGCDESVHSISEHIEILQGILDQMDPELKNMAEWNIKEIEIYFVVKKEVFGVAILGKYNFCDSNKYEKHFFAFNQQQKNGNVQQVLFHCENLSLSGDDYEKLYPKFFRNGISSNRIQLDTFYDEGIMNA